MTRRLSRYVIIPFLIFLYLFYDTSSIEHKDLEVDLEGSFLKITPPSFHQPNQDVRPLMTSPTNISTIERLTLIAVWNGLQSKPYLQQLFQSAELNKDFVDLLFVVRLSTTEEQCAPDFPIPLSKNIKVVCLTDLEWYQRHSDFLCSREYGWGCSHSLTRSVFQHISSRRDNLNCEWKPLRGWILRDLMQTNLWAWIDVDVTLGNFAEYPFQLLSSLSFLTGFYSQPTMAFMAGQMTAFNMKDPFIGKAWMKIPSLRSASTFLYSNTHPKYIGDEGFWSHNYMDSEEESAGSGLSWAIIADLHGQDFFPTPSSSYVIWRNEVFFQLEPINFSELIAGEVKKNSNVTKYVAKDISLRSGVHCDKKWIPLRYTHCLDLRSRMPTGMETDMLVRLRGRPANTLHHIIRPQANATSKSKLFMHYQRLKKRQWFQFYAPDATSLIHIRHDQVQRYTLDELR